jgi:hypothetical protein
VLKQVVDLAQLLVRDYNFMDGETQPEGLGGIHGI